MSLVKVKNYFANFKMEDRIIEFDSSSKTVFEAANLLNCKEERIAKSLSFKLKEKVIVIVVAGDKKIDNKKYKETFNEKAKMLNYDEVEELTGHVVGGVCPFALNDGVLVYLDVSLKQFETVFPACGSSNSAIEVTIEELEKYSNFVDFVDVCK
jgi:prolyl-tRNA editing enzyme YbaK/EbsC (Cys-tRNA(Pro) deacylase)